MKIRFLIPLCCFIAIVFLLGRGLSLHPNQIPSPLVGKEVPHFSLPDLLNDENLIKEKALTGYVTLVNVWATWCFACAQEHEMLLELAQKENIRILGLDYKDDNKAAKDWLKKYGNPYVLIGSDETGNTAIDWGVYGTPETFIVDKKGIIRYKHIGPITSDVWDETLKPLIHNLEVEA